MENENERIWNGKRVLVTGATGFIGSWLTEDLVKRGADITALVKKNDPIQPDSIKHIKSDIKIVHGDIVNRKDVEKAVNGNEVIFHLAAVTQVLHAADNPAYAMQVNFLGTFNILETMRKRSDGFLVMTSTDKVYGEPEKLPIKEGHQLSSKSPYDAAKLAADRMVYAYNKTYGLKSTIVRFSNVYGGRDQNELRIIPGCIASVMRGDVPVIRRSGQDVRDYVHVDDIVRGFILAVENDSISNGEEFNFGTSKPTKTIDVVNMTLKAMGSDKKPVILGKQIAGEIDKQYMSYDKAKKKLGWKPEVKLDYGIKLTVEWYMNNQWWIKIMEKASKHHLRKNNKQ